MFSAHMSSHLVHVGGQPGAILPLSLSQLRLSISRCHQRSRTDPALSLHSISALNFHSAPENPKQCNFEAILQRTLLHMWRPLNCEQLLAFWLRSGGSPRDLQMSHNSICQESSRSPRTRSPSHTTTLSWSQRPQKNEHPTFLAFDFMHENPGTRPNQLQKL